MRLNKYLAQSGVSSRREADELIQGATVTVNGIVEINPAYNVQSSDKVRYDNKRIQPESNIRLILLNKPNGYITTVKDPLRRKTVMDLIQSEERLFPVGRLDKDTSGLHN
jgi:23S rRNA pseudouridine2605 synthase